MACTENVPIKYIDFEVSMLIFTILLWSYKLSSTPRMLGNFVCPSQNILYLLKCMRMIDKV